MVDRYEMNALDPTGVLSYSRKSRSDDPALSIDEVLAKHESRLNEWAEQNLSAPIPLENQYKELVSGESISERTEFRKLLKRIESPDIKAVLVVDLARLGRPDTEEIGMISKLFWHTNTLVITPERTFNVADKFEREMFESQLKMSNSYLEYTKMILNRGREISIKSGNFVGSKPIYGYDRAVIVEGKRKCPTLTINEEQANVVRKIFNDFVNENIGAHIIANRLNDLGIKSPGGQVWVGDSVRTILKNIHYTGRLRWNRRKTVCVVVNGEIRKTRPVADDKDVLVCEGKHEAIVSDEIFNAAQEKMRNNHRTVDNKELRNPFASLLYCQCGKILSYKHDKRSGKKTPQEPRFVCNGQKFCHSTSCTVEELVDYVVMVLREKIADFTCEIENYDSGEDSFHEKHLRSLEKKLADINGKELSLWESKLDKENQMPKNVFDTLKVKLEKEREETEAAIEKARTTVRTRVTYESHIVTLEKALSALTDPSASVAEKNQFLKACIERIEYKRGASVRLKGQGVGRGWVTPPIELDIRLKI